MSWSILAGSSVGSGHDRAALSTQDAHAAAEIGPALVVAVADGAGTAACAATGASLAVRVAQQETGRLLRERGETGFEPLVRDAARHTLHRFRRAVIALADGARLHPRDFATTLTVVLARPPWVGVFAVGDGFVVIRRGDGDLGLLLAPPRGSARPPGATTLLPGRPGLGVIRHRAAREHTLTGLAAGTDGVRRC